jgi:ubiquinone/menaquinone biosynthesis C-methylase UbiE
MEPLRKPFQGITNIIRFNWHFYVIAIALVFIIFFCNQLLNNNYHFYAAMLCIVITATTLISALASFYIYDLSNLYGLHWLDKLNIGEDGSMININAGFDETSELLYSKYPDAELIVFDFYDPEKHTEISIKRARKVYPPYKDTRQISTDFIPLKDNSADNILVIFAAHEIRNDNERVVFFKELNRVIKYSGKIIITEHVRNLPNFFVYNIGAFHFLSASCWSATFSKADLIVCEKIKITPFITTFILTKNGTSS